MSFCEYGNEEIREIEIVYIVASYIIAVVVLTIPRILASETNFSDGWVSMILAGMLSIFSAGFIAKLASYFPNQTFYTYASLICSKPVAVLITLWFVIYFLVVVGYEVRYVAVITKQYVLDRTPVEISSLLFLFVIAYAVSGSRVGLIQLNLLFFPIIIFVVLLVSFLNLPNFEIKNLSPFFTTGWYGYWQGAKGSFFSIAGSEILFFYTALVKRPKNVTKYAMISVCIPLGLYLVIYIMSIGVFTAETTKTLVFPTIELAKEATIPGAFLERVEPLFFTIWIMGIFNTASIAYDIALIALNSLFQQIKKIMLIFILTPLIYLIAMFPENITAEVTELSIYMSFSSFILGVLLPLILLLLVKLRGIKGNE